MKRFVLRLGAEAPDQVSWALRSDDGSIQPGHGSLLEAAAAIGRGRVTVLVPGQDVLLLAAKLPKGSRQRIAQAIPFAVEEDYVSDAEELHFGQGARDAAGRLALALVASTRMDGWLAMLQAAGIDPQTMVPDILAAPFQPDGWTIVVDGGLALVRTAQQQGFAVDIDNLEAVLRTELAALPAGEPLTLHLHAPPGQAPLAGADFAPHTVDAQPMAAVVAVLAAALDDKVAIDLLQGPYNRHAQWGNLWVQWRTPVALLLVLLLMRGGLLGQEYFALRHEAGLLAQQIEKVYRDQFPEAKKVVNPRAQMEQQLAGLRAQGQGGGAFLGQVGKITPVLLAAPGFVIQSLRYADGRLELGFLVSSLQGLDELKTKLAGLSGLEVEIRTASAKADSVEARMQIKEAGR
ncbi:MAG: type II secretion system protein GspL [Deltaproteobacteria bacterium CG_4_10_14_3_um_filter_60_8]|nr:MAG: type II secretion system protein GspL [Deltaproteobacteria bacterium CG_4_10_14_3_um_filter_60_8]